MPDSADIIAFIARWRANRGGAERANYVLFLTELCHLLDLPQPDPADSQHDRNDYVFERAVDSVGPDGQVSHRRIDLYRRDSFVLEAKQSREAGGGKAVALPPEQAGLPGLPPPETLGRRSVQRGWDVLMRNAFEQAKQYAEALPPAHGWPPFILVCDVGHAIEVWADFNRQGRYRHYPDRAGYRVYLDELTDPAVRDRLARIWTDPLSLDPARRAAEVTRDIARRLAAVSKSLEARGRSPAEVAHFLMRCLFTMFAQSERVRLLDPGDFTRFLDEACGQADSFAPLLEELWRGMDRGDVSALLRKRVRRFNGGLFHDAHAIPLNREEIGELYEASRHDWTDVEPAIFGTLLEQALDPQERRRLGAHYTPRAYVERLVAATVIAPLQLEWELMRLGTVERERQTDRATAIRTVREFHVKLAQTRILDPACGTGNFLYVALEMMKRLEGEVLEVLAELGGEEALRLETETVHPKNFLGLEVNARAAAIAELVLWLGYIQWQLRNGRSITDPVLEELRTIEVRDAVLRHDGERMSAGRGSTELANPRRPSWPEADYIVGNPPFIGGKDLRGRLGDAYLTALWKAHPAMGRSADLVMYWWDHAAELLTRKATRLKRFGFVTTNSIVQEFSRRAIARRLAGRPPVSLVQAIPDHPWTKATRDAAAVRIAMTVAEAGAKEGRLLTVVGESGLSTETPAITFTEVAGRINADLTIGTDLGGAHGLLANAWLCSRGVSLHGAGFMVTPAQAALLGLGRREGLERHIRPYRNGRDLTGRARGLMVIDLLGLSEAEVRRRYPEVYQHLLTTVRPERDRNNRAAYRDNWWLFGEPRRELRPALAGLPRYIATVETAKHRVFQFLDAAVLPDNMLVCIASDDPFHLGVLSSRFGTSWAAVQGGTLEDRPRFTKTQCFDPFAFPLATSGQRMTIGGLAAELDAARKEVLADHPDLTLTGLYNLRDAVAAGGALTPRQQDQRRRGRIDLIAELHRRVDAAVAQAYGWPADLAAGDVVVRLVGLNAERRADERRGHVHWLRPEYQPARAGLVSVGTAREEQIEAPLPAFPQAKPSFPRDAVGQTAAVFECLRGGQALTAAAIADRFAQGGRSEPRVAATLAALERLGHVAGSPAGFSLRRVA